MRAHVLAISLIVWLVFAVALGLPPYFGAGVFWDIANAFGFATIAGLFVVFLTAAKPVNQAAHKNLSFAVFMFTLLHIFILLLGDGAAVTYVRKGAPLYMWAGLVASGLLVALIWHSLQPLRTSLHSKYSSFSQWHRWFAVFCLGLAIWHVVGSNYYVKSNLQVIVLIAFSALLALRPFTKRILMQPHANSWLVYCANSMLASLVFVAIRNYQA